MKLLLLLTGNKESEKTTRKYWHGRAWKDRVEFTRWICEGWVKISSLGLTMGHSKCYRFWKHTKRNRNNCSKADLGFIWFIYKHSYLKISFPSDFVKMSHWDHSSTSPDIGWMLTRLADVLTLLLISLNLHVVYQFEKERGRMERERERGREDREGREGRE